MADREDFERSIKRAKKWQSRTTVEGETIRDFMWVTGKFHLFPKRYINIYKGWNVSGGESVPIVHIRRYWLTMGWSIIEPLAKHDRRNGDIQLMEVSKDVNNT